eukprot:IDg8673t1
MTVPAFTSPVYASTLSARSFFGSTCSRRSFSGTVVARNVSRPVASMKADEQSPVNLPITGTRSEHVRHAPLVNEGTSVHLEPEFEEPNMNYHLLTDNSTDGGSIMFNNTTYTLSQLHLHAPSENHLDGRVFPVEMHLVHTKERKISVLGIFFDYGAHNAEFEKILSALEKKTTSTINIVDMLGLGLDRADLLAFNGSLTTGKFERNVQWIVSKEIPHISTIQYDRFKKVMDINFPNAREIQPLNNREIISYYGV